MSYAIGVAEPTSISLNTFGTGKIADSEIIKLVREHFDLRPQGLIAMLDLKRPIYQQTAAYGHFGRELPNFTLGKTDRAAALQKPFLSIQRRIPTLFIQEFFMSFTDYKVADVPSRLGPQKIEIAEGEMPALMALRRKYKASKPLADAKIIGCIHMTIQTAVLI